jgi:hypothetical protein
VNPSIPATYPKLLGSSFMSFTQIAANITEFVGAVSFTCLSGN